MLSDDHRGRIREYLRQGEGAPPPIFVGHRDIFDDILRIAQDSAGKAKFTRIVQGAPGAGKSSLLHEMQRRWTGEADTPRVVEVSSEAVIQNTSGVIKAIMAAGTVERPTWSTILRERFRKIRAIGGSVAGYGLSAEFNIYDSTGLVSEAMEEERNHPWLHTVILAVDEAQALQGDPASIPACFLREIHNGRTGLPINLVLAGLSDTDARAEAMNLTRERTVHEVAPLELVQTQRFIRGLALYFGLDISRHETYLDALAEPCDGWPRHLRHAGVALAKETERTDGVMDHMDWRAMERHVRTMRQRYYGKQTSRTMRRSHRLLAEILRDIPVSSDETDVTDVDIIDHMNHIHRQREGGGSIAWTLPRGRDAHWFLSHLIHQGVLYESGSGYIHSPIPSFRTFLMEKGKGWEGRAFTPDSESRTGETDDGPEP